MVWAKDKTIVLSVGDEEISVTFRIPTASEREEILPLMEGKFTKWSVIVKKLVTRIEGCGLVSVDELLNAPGAGDIVVIIGSQIMLASSLDVSLKNESSSSTV